MNKFKISHLKAMKKGDIYALCLKEFGNDTVSVYQHYTKSEMIDDLMSVAMNGAESRQAAPSETPAEPIVPTHQLEILFAGFYQSHHAEQPNEVIEHDIDNAYENDINLDDEIIDKIWDKFNDGFDWHKYFDQVANRYAYFVLSSVLDTSQDLAQILQRVAVESPREYNFVNDKIYATMTQRPQKLTLQYFKDNDLVEPLLWFIKARHSSYDGYISFVNPNPTLDEVFAVSDNNLYIDCAMYVLTCQAFELDPYDGYSHNANEIDRQFIYYMYAHGYYDDFIYGNMPSVCFDLMQGKQS